MATLVRIDPIGGDDTDLDLWRQSWRLWNAGTRRQYGPEANQIDADTLLEHRRRTGDPFAHVVACERDIVVGRLDLVINPRDEPDVVHAEFEVMPPWRGQGLGQELWAAAQPLVAELGGRVLASHVTERLDDPGAADDATHLLEKNGFAPVGSSLISELPIDGDLSAVGVPHGYRLDVVVDTPDEAVLGSLAELHQGLEDDAPRAGERGARRWSAEALRDGFERSGRLGLRHVTVAVVHEDSGEIVGMSGNSWAPTNPTVVHQGGTYVRPGHRGLGLATAAKSLAIAEMATLAEGATVNRTMTPETDRAMRDMDRRLGYRPTHRQTDWRKQL